MAIDNKKVNIVTVLNNEQKISKIFSITCNNETCSVVAEWCFKNKVKIIIHEDIEDYKIMTTYFDYNKKSKYWYMFIGVENNKAYINLYEDREKNNF